MITMTDTRCEARFALKLAGRAAARIRRNTGANSAETAAAEDKHQALSDAYFADFTDADFCAEDTKARNEAFDAWLVTVAGIINLAAWHGEA